MKNILATLGTVMLAAAVLVSCGPASYDGPPAVTTPDPDPLSGIYISDRGTMTFNGDGRTVIVDLDEDAEKIIPDGEYEYDFMWWQGGSVRYDIATDFLLATEDVYYEFKVYGASIDRISLSYYYTDDENPDGVTLNMVFDLADDGAAE